MTDQELKNYMHERRERQKDARSHFKFRLEAGDYSQGWPKWATSQAFSMFAEAVYEKAMLAREKYGFNELGWAIPDWQEELQKGIAEHLLKGDPRDVAVYAMFAWFHGWPTAPALPVAVSGGETVAPAAASVSGGAAEGDRAKRVEELKWIVARACVDSSDPRFDAASKALSELMGLALHPAARASDEPRP